MSGDDERWDEDPEELSADNAALLAFATNFEFVKRLVRIVGRDALKPEGRQEIARWLEIMIDGADHTLLAMVSHGAMTADTMTLAKEVEEARNWIAVELIRPGTPG